jgi:hypothetical protein
MKLLTITALLALPVVLVNTMPQKANAEQAIPQAILTWQAESFVPHWYPGKSIPTQGTLIKAAIELLKEGKTLDLAKYEIRWFIDGKLAAKGSGSKTMQFRAGAGNSNSHIVRAQITDGKNILLEKFVEIPILEPRVSLLPLLPEDLIGRGAQEFTAVPFFFNIKNVRDLDFKWVVNNQTPQEENVDEPEKLSFVIPEDILSNTPLMLSVVALNKNNPLEQGHTRLQLKVK